MKESKYKNRISRRTFLKTAGAGIAAAGLGSVTGSKVAKKVIENIGSIRRNPTGMAIGDADYYVSTDGDDSNPGTQNDPLGSIHEAVSRVSAGETIVVRGGEYQYSNGNPVVVDGKSGSSSNPISITSPSGERPHFKWEGGWTDWDMQGGFEFRNGASYWSFNGIEVSNCPSVGIRAYENSKGFTFRNMHIHGNGNSGIQVKGSDHKIINVESFNNYDEPNGGEDADGLVMERVDNGLIENCVCYNNSDDGIDMWESRNCTVRKLICFNNGRGDSGDGNGIKSANTNTGGNNRFIRCIAYNNRNHGIRTYSPDSDQVINCTSYNNGSHGFAAIEGGDHEIVNCIEYGSQNDYSFHGGVNDHDNNWNQGINNPQFQSTNPNSEDFLRLASGSPSIDAGTDVGLDFSGSAPDLGAYEKGMSYNVGLSEEDSTRETTGDTTSKITVSGGSTSDPLNYIIEGENLVKVSEGGKIMDGVAIGTLTGNNHTYQYQGRLTDFRAEEGIQVKIDGEKISGVEITDLICQS